MTTYGYVTDTEVPVEVDTDVTGLEAIVQACAEHHYVKARADSFPLHVFDPGVKEELGDMGRWLRAYLDSVAPSDGG